MSWLSSLAHVMAELAADESSSARWVVTDSAALLRERSIQVTAQRLIARVLSRIASATITTT
jgi:hypothetical protein